MNQERSKINNNEKDLFVHQKDKETREDGGGKKNESILLYRNKELFNPAILRTKTTKL